MDTAYSLIKTERYLRVDFGKTVLLEKIEVQEYQLNCVSKEVMYGVNK